MIKVFRLNRDEDESGISGTGIVAEGVQFSNGLCVVSWLTVPEGYDKVPCGVGVYKNMNHVKAVHGHGGKTHVEWFQPPIGTTGIW